MACFVPRRLSGWEIVVRLGKEPAVLGFLGWGIAARNIVLARLAPST